MTEVGRSESLEIRGHVLWRDDFGWWRYTTVSGDAVRVSDPLLLALLDEVRLARLIDRTP